MEFHKYLKKYFYIIFILAFIINSFLVYEVNKKFNKYEVVNNQIVAHKIIKGDSLKYWKIANELNKDFFLFPYDFRNAQLYPKIIFLFNKFTSQSFFDDEGNPILNSKFNIFYFQLIFYFFSLFFLYKSLLINISSKLLPEIIILFLSLDRFINQMHYSVYAESIFISLLIILISLILRLRKNIFKKTFIIGILLGMLFMQRTVAIYYILALIPFFLIYFKNHKTKIIFALFSGYSLVCCFILIMSYNSIGIPRISPTQIEDGIYGYLVPNVYAKKNNISLSESKKIFFNDKTDEFIEDNNLNINNFKDFDKLSKFKKDFAKQFLLNNSFQTAQVLIFNYSKSLFIYPNFITEFFNTAAKKDFETIEKKKRIKNSFLIRSIYSFIFILLSIIGFIFSFKILNKNFILFLFLSALYFFLISGWVGNPRYFLPSYVFILFFSATGFYSIFFYLKKI